MTDKQSIRREIRARRQSLPQEARDEAAQQAISHLLAWDVYRSARSVLAYAAVRGELDVRALLEDALACGKALCLPRCEAGGEMTARRVTGLRALERSAYGIPEPGPGAPVCAAGEIDLAIVPGIAFDARGVRIGQGGGYYDRFLPRFRGVAAGIGYTFQVYEALPSLSHDAAVDYVIHPAGIICCRRQGGKRSERHEKKDNGGIQGE